MHDGLTRLSCWWAGGDVLMPVMLLVALVLYGLVGERIWTLCGPATWADRRRAELRALAGDARWRTAWLAVAEHGAAERGLDAIRVLALVLPLLGLLGTVTGMIDTFAALGESGSGATRASAAGIGLALTATQYGMALAVPAMIAERVLRQRARALMRQREQAVAEAAC